MPHRKHITGQTYEDSIQELNNLIGELDSFQREHEMKMKQKQREKQQQQQQQQQSKLLANGHDAHNTTGDTTMTASSIGDMSDIYNSLDKLSISSCDPNPLMCSTITHSSEMTYGSDIGDGLNDLTDCQATTMSLKLNLSTTEHPLVMQHRHNHHNSSNSLNAMTASISNQSISNGSTSVIRNIELIPDSYNVSDDYVKEHTEIVVLRRKNSQTDLNGEQHETNANPMQNHINGNATMNVNENSSGKDVERISSFRCSSFSKTDSNDGTSTLKRGQSMSSADTSKRYNGNEYASGMPVMMMMTTPTQYDQDVVDHPDSTNSGAQMTRHKPVITPRPASLSGLFFYYFYL